MAANDPFARSRGAIAGGFQTRDRRAVIFRLRFQKIALTRACQTRDHRFGGPLMIAPVAPFLRTMR